MKKINNLFIYNNGIIVYVANFNCFHDAVICLNAMDKNQMKARERVCENLFYFLEWQDLKKNIHIYIEANNYSKYSIYTDIINDYKKQNCLKSFTPKYY